MRKVGLPHVLSPSPILIIDRTFTSIFFFEPKPRKKEKPTRYYRNPIHLATEYRRRIETSEVKNQSELVNKLFFSQARVCQVPVILKLDDKLM